METTVNPRCRPEEIYNSHMLLLDRDAGASSSTGRTLVSSPWQWLCAKVWGGRGVSRFQERPGRHSRVSRGLL